MSAARLPASAEPSADDQHFLRRAAQMLSSAPDFEEALQQTMAVALPTLGDFGFFDIVDGETVRRTVRAHQADDIEAILKPTAWVRQQRSDINLCALSTGEPALHADIDDAWYVKVAESPEHLAVLRQARLVAAHRRGQEIYYALNTSVFQDLIQHVMGWMPQERRTTPVRRRAQEV